MIFFGKGLLSVLMSRQLWITQAPPPPPPPSFGGVESLHNVYLSDGDPHSPRLSRSTTPAFCLLLHFHPMPPLPPEPDLKSLSLLSPGMPQKPEAPVIPQVRHWEPGPGVIWLCLGIQSYFLPAPLLPLTTPWQVHVHVLGKGPQTPTLHLPILRGCWS